MSHRDVLDECVVTAAAISPHRLSKSFNNSYVTDIFQLSNSKVPVFRRLC